MELIKRYAADVSRRIWRRDREDIRQELETALMDEVEQRYGPEGSEEQVVEMLREYGHPGTVAGRYQDETRYLIGPRIFPQYIRTLKIILLAAGIGLVVSQVISLWGQGATNPAVWAGGLLRILYGAGLRIFGGITLVFCLFERFAEPKDLEEEEEEWDPRTLPPVPGGTERVRPVGHVAAIVFLGVALFLLNALGDSLGLIYWDAEGTRQVVGLFEHTRLAVYRPFLNVLLGASILYHAFLLAAGQVRSWTRLASIAISGATLALVLLLWRNRPFFVETPELSAELLSLVDAMEAALPVVLGVLFLGLLWDIGREIWHLSRIRPGSGREK